MAPVVLEILVDLAAQENLADLTVHKKVDLMALPVYQEVSVANLVAVVVSSSRSC